MPNLKHQLVLEAFDQIRQQVDDDSDIEEGQYFFTLEKCPKSEAEAALIEAKKIESIIQEESDENSRSLFSSIVQTQKDPKMDGSN